MVLVLPLLLLPMLPMLLMMLLLLQRVVSNIVAHSHLPARLQIPCYKIAAS